MGHGGSVVEDFGIGFIIPFFHASGITPFLKHILNKRKSILAEASFFKTSTGCSSYPGALPFFVSFKAIRTSSRTISLLKT